MWPLQRPAPSSAIPGLVEPLDLLRLLLDPRRLAVVGSVATCARTVDEICALTGVERRTVLTTLAALEAGDAVVTHAGRWRLDPAVLRDAAQRLPQPAPPDPAMFHGMTRAERDILARFFHGDQLTEIPVSRGKRLVVLERLALEFEPGRRYHEREVNEVLGRFHEDYASLRRYLVDEQLLDRSEGRYWRAGGRVLV